MTDDQPADPATFDMLPKTLNAVRDRGIWFRNAVATTPLCCPSRVSLFTGQYAHNHGITQNNASGFSDHSSTLQYALRKNGYKTAVSGKFLNGWDADPPHFDRWAITGKVGYYDTQFNVDGTIERTDEYSTSFIEGRALEFLNWFEREDQSPWLMYVLPIAPHPPAIPETRYEGTPVPPWSENPARRETDLSDKPGYVAQRISELSKAQRVRKRMLLSLISVDNLVGALVQRMKDLDETNTMIWYLSDNGFLWHEHQLIDKRFPYNESVRVPMFLSWPGHLEAGRADLSVVATIDVAPTIYEATGIQPDHSLDGRSVLNSDRAHILTEYWRSPNVAIPTWRAIWSPDRMYVEYPESGEAEYYASADPWQLDNLAANGSAPPEAEDLAGELKSAYDCSGSGCP